tara:strand:- start:104 stop:220 length:117 start_codon:yes stop_codon:yes gene_type:complete
MLNRSAFPSLTSKGGKRMYGKKKKGKKKPIKKKKGKKY